MQFDFEVTKEIHEKLKEIANQKRVSVTEIISNIIRRKAKIIELIYPIDIIDEDKNIFLSDEIPIHIDEKFHKKLSDIQFRYILRSKSSILRTMVKRYFRN